MPEQIQATTGRRIRRPYQSMISVQAAQLPKVYEAKEEKQFQEEALGLRARELLLAEESQKKQEEQAKKASMIGAAGTGAMIGGQVGGPYGALWGAGIGVGAWAASEYLDISIPGFD